jgi:hypothetical protein
MKALLYVLAVLLGVMGAAGVLRFLERMATGAEGSGSPFAQLIVGLAFILLAYKSYTKARGRTIPGNAASPQV